MFCSVVVPKGSKSTTPALANCLIAISLLLNRSRNARFESKTYEPIQPSCLPDHFPDQPFDVLWLGNVNLDPDHLGFVPGLLNELDQAREMVLDDITGIDGLGSSGGILEDSGTTDA